MSRLHFENLRFAAMLLCTCDLWIWCPVRLFLCALALAGNCYCKVIYICAIIYLFKKIVKCFRVSGFLENCRIRLSVSFRYRYAYPYPCYIGRHCRPGTGPQPALGSLRLLCANAQGSQVRRILPIHKSQPQIKRSFDFSSGQSLVEARWFQLYEFVAVIAISSVNMWLREVSLNVFRYFHFYMLII